MIRVSRRGLLRGAGAAGGLGGCGSKLATWRTFPPDDADAITLALPRYLHRVTADGTDVWLAARPGAPLASVSLVLDAGFNRDPLDRPSRSWVLGRLLHEGTRTYDRRELQAAFGALGGTFRSDAGGRALVLSTTVLAPSAPNALSLMGDLLEDAEAPEERLDALRNTYRAPRRISAERLGVAATIDALVGDRSGTDLAPYRNTLETVTPPELRATMNEAATRRPRAVVIAGGIDPDRGLESIESITRHFPALVAQSPSPPRKTSPRESPGVIVVDRPGDEAVLSYAQLGPAVNEPGYDAYDLAATFLLQRVWYQLRERQRNAYGVLEGTWLTPAGVLTHQFTRIEPFYAAHALEGLVEMLDTLADWALDTKYATELRTWWLLNAMDGFQRTRSLANTAVSLHTHGLPPDYYQQRVKAIDGFDMSRVHEAFVEYFHRNKVQIVLVGPADRLAAAAERVQSRPVEVIDGAALARSLNR